jgi:hypothetical protein
MLHHSHNMLHLYPGSCYKNGRARALVISHILLQLAIKKRHYVTYVFIPRLHNFQSMAQFAQYLPPRAIPVVIKYFILQVATRCSFNTAFKCVIVSFSPLLVASS